MHESRLLLKSRYMIAPEYTPRRVGSSSSMISMARTFGAPETVPAGKARHHCIQPIDVAGKLASERGHQMHHVRITLDEHEFFDTNGTVLADSAEIVSAKIHEHDVLGALLLVGLKLLREALVFGIICAARSSSRDGSVRHVVSLDPHEHFRRRSYDRGVRHLQEVHVGRGIHDPKRSINLERRGLEVDFKSLRQHHLEDVPGRDVFLRFGDRIQVIALFEVRPNLKFLACWLWVPEVRSASAGSTSILRISSIACAYCTSRGSFDSSTSRFEMMWI